VRVSPRRVAEESAVGEWSDRRHYPRIATDFPTDVASDLDDGQPLPDPPSPANERSLEHELRRGPPPPDLSAHMMQNLSVGGCFIKTRTPEAAGALVSVRFALPGEPTRPMVKATGRVAWIRSDSEGPSGMGIQFVKVEDKDLADIREYLIGH
jgi:uncharacterized protein (TIGR02266 family)